MSRVHHLELEDTQSVESFVNETQLWRKELSYKIRPILRLMKLFGEYYGDTSMDERLQSDSSFFSRFYCGLVLIGQWFLVVQASTNLFI